MNGSSRYYVTAVLGTNRWKYAKISSLSFYKSATAHDDVLFWNLKQNVRNNLSSGNSTRLWVQFFEPKIIRSVWIQICGLKTMSSIKSFQSWKSRARKKLKIWESHKKLKNSQNCLNIPQIICSGYYGRTALGEFSRKRKLFQNSKNALKRSQKCSNMSWTCFEVIFWKFFLPIVLRGGGDLEKFQKIENFPNFQNAQNVPKSVQKCFKNYLRQFFENFCAQITTVGRHLKKNQRSSKFSKFSKKAMGKLSLWSPNISGQKLR